MVGSAYWFLFSVLAIMPPIDFVHLKASVPILAVLELLGFVPVERHGDQIRGACPLHGASSPSSRSFSANLAKNTFQCFRCKASGNQLDLWAKVQKVPIYDAAQDLCQRLGVSVPTKPTPSASNAQTEKRNQ
jgi:DNA primase